MLLHPPTPLSSLLTPVIHPQDLHPHWSQLTDEHTWKKALLNRLQLLSHSCVYRIIWILNLIHKWEPTGWVRSLDLVLAPWNRLLSTAAPGAPGHGSAKWRPDPKETNSDAVWELLPIVTGHSEPEWGDTWTIQEDSSFHPTEVPSAKLPEVPWSPTPLSQGKPCNAGALWAWFHFS